MLSLLAVDDRKRLGHHGVEEASLASSLLCLARALACKHDALTARMACFGFRCIAALERLVVYYLGSVATAWSMLRQLQLGLF